MASSTNLKRQVVIMAKGNKYVDSSSKSESTLVGQIREAADRREQHLSAASNFERNRVAAYEEAIAATGALNALIKLAGDIGVDLTKHFPPAKTTEEAVQPLPAGSADASKTVPAVGELLTAETAEAKA
jgi:hypothetical protein